MARNISEADAARWQRLADMFRTAEKALADAPLVLMDLGAPMDGGAYEALRRAEEALRGQAYMFTPQPEWTGGDSLDPANFRIRAPHIAGP